MIKSVADLKVYEKAHRLAMEIFELTRGFPKEEVYSLTDQMRRAARSVAINIREGFAKRRYEQLFIRHLNDALGSCEETRGWLRFAVECEYLTRDKSEKVDEAYDEVSAMLYSLMEKWRSDRVSEGACDYPSSPATSSSDL